MRIFSNSGVGGGVSGGPYILTCAHVIRDGGLFMDTGPAMMGPKASASIVHVDNALDIGLATNPLGLPGVQLADEAPVNGQLLVGLGDAMGNGAGAVLLTAELERTASNDYGNNVQPLLVCDGLIQPGDSGGPVFSMDAGLLGLFGTYLPGGSRCGLIPLDVIRPYLVAHGVSPAA